MNEEEIRIPADLGRKAEDAILAAVLAEKGLDGLTPQPRRRRLPRWAWAAAPAAALAALGCVLYFGHARPGLSDPAAEAVYAQVELAFSSFCEAACAGYDIFSDQPASR